MGKKGSKWFSIFIFISCYPYVTRKNDSSRMTGTRIQLSQLFYSFNHTIYQKVFIPDLIQQSQVPERIFNYFTSHESFTISGEKDRGESADFVHTGNNRMAKSFLLPGIPTSVIWKRVCRKATGLNQLKINA